MNYNPVKVDDEKQNNNNLELVKIIDYLLEQIKKLGG